MAHNVFMKTKKLVVVFLLGIFAQKQVVGKLCQNAELAVRFEEDKRNETSGTRRN